MQPSPYEEFTRSLNVPGLRIRNFPSLIFLCGGPTTEAPDLTGYARDAFLKYVRAHHPVLIPRFLLAEEIADWVDDDAYHDLLSLEKDLAHLSALTVLFVESPGSIAELGAFSLLEPVTRRLLPVFQSRFSDNRSFIDLGPRRFLQGKPNATVLPHFYPWNPHPDQGRAAEPFSTEDAADLTVEIERQLDMDSRTRIFDPEDPGHLMLLLAELVALLTISRLSDLRRLVEGLNIPRALDNLAQYLFLLRKLGRIEKFRYGHEDFFIAPSSSTYISYSFTRGTRVKERHRWRQLFREHASTKDDRKWKAMRSRLRPNASETAIAES